MKSRRTLPRIIVAIALGCLAFPFAATQWEKYHRPPIPQNFRFPTAELAALDRDLQARFAVVPEKDFGIMRTYGNQHYLYDPSTSQERQTIRAFKKRDTEVAFYLMSRALWLRHWDGLDFKPIQGPVVITEKIKLPLPRKINFYPTDSNPREAILLQPRNIPYQNPDGTPVPAPSMPPEAPGVNRLQEIGNDVFEMAEAAPPNARVGVSTEIRNWQVVAVPIRATEKACLPCHTYDSRAPQGPPGKVKVDVGDALGVAFYAYRTLPPARQKQPSIAQRTQASR